MLRLRAGERLSGSVQTGFQAPGFSSGPMPTRSVIRP
jgi:hypothetical protein